MLVGNKMSYCPIDEDTKTHLLKLIDFLYEEVRSASGDGDAIWYSIFYDIKEIFPIIEEFNSKQKYPWSNLELYDDDISWWNGQESILITNDKAKFDNRPNWQQCSVVL